MYQQDVAGTVDTASPRHAAHSFSFPSITRHSHPPFHPSTTNPSTVQPSDIWNATLPSTVCYSDLYHVLFVAIATPLVPNTILAINTTTQLVIANLTLPFPLFIRACYVAEAVSGEWTQFVWATDFRGVEQSYIVRIDGYGDVVGMMNTSVALLGVSGDGASMLAMVSVNDSVSEVQLLDAVTGQQKAVYTGGLQYLSPAGGVLNPVTGDVWVFDRLASAVYGISSTNQLFATVSLARTSFANFIGFVGSNDGFFAYLAFITDLSLTPNCTLLQLDIASNSTRRGAVLSNVTLAGATYSPLSFAPTNAPGQLYIANSLNNTVDLLTNNGTTLAYHYTFGTHSVLYYPTDVAAHGDRVYVASNYPQGFTALSVAGELVGAVQLDDVSGCPNDRYQNVAVTGRGSVLLPLCNGTLLEYNARLELVRSIQLDGRVLPQAIAVATSTSNATSVWLTDDNNPAVISRYNLHTGKVEATLHGASNSAFVSLAIDHIHNNGSLWAADSNTSAIYHWSTTDGRLLSVWNLSQPTATVLILGLAIDTAHRWVVVAQQWTDHARREVQASYVVWLDMTSGVVVRNYTFSAEADEQVSGVGVSADGGRMYATSMNSGSVLVFDQTSEERKAVSRVSAE